MSLERRDRRPLLVALRPLGLGDHLTAVPALRALADAFPDHRRVLATSAPMVPLAAHVGPLDEVVAVSPLGALDCRLGRPDVAVDLHGRGPASQRRLIELDPRRLISFAHPDVAGTAGGPSWRASEHEVHRWCRMLEGSGVPADPGRLDVAPPGRAVPAMAVGATVVHPGAASEARRWPVERYAELARAERASGREVVITGGPADIGLAGRLAQLAGVPDEAVLAGRTGVLGLLDVVSVAALVLSGDTGVAHVATAVGTPSVVLFGPVPPDEWGPPPERRKHVALWAGRRGDPHGFAVDPGLLRLDVGTVAEAVRRIHASAPAGS